MSPEAEEGSEENRLSKGHNEGENTEKTDVEMTEQHETQLTSTVSGAKTSRPHTGVKSSTDLAPADVAALKTAKRELNKYGAADNDAYVSHQCMYARVCVDVWMYV